MVLCIFLYLIFLNLLANLSSLSQLKAPEIQVGSEHTSFFLIAECGELWFLFPFLKIRPQTSG